MGAFRFVVDVYPLLPAHLAGIQDVDPGATLAAWCCGRRVSLLCWRAVCAWRVWSALGVLGMAGAHAAFLLADETPSAPLASPASLAPLPGLGWTAALAAPALFVSFAYAQSAVVCVLFRLPLPNLLRCLNVVYVCCAVDMVAYVPSRIFAVLCIALSMEGTLWLDAREYGSTRNGLMRWPAFWTTLVGAVLGFAVVLVYLLGGMDLARATTIPLGGGVHVPTLGMCAFALLCVARWHAIYRAAGWNAAPGSSVLANPLVWIHVPAGFMDTTQPVFSPRASAFNNSFHGGLSTAGSVPAMMPFSTNAGAGPGVELPSLSRPASMRVGSTSEPRRPSFVIANAQARLQGIHESAAGDSGASVSSAESPMGSPHPPARQPAGRPVELTGLGRGRFDSLGTPLSPMRPAPSAGAKDAGEIVDV